MTMTVISFEHSADKIRGFETLPEEVRCAIHAAKYILSRGFQELIGYDEDNRILWSALGYWDGQKNREDELFVIESLYGMKCPLCKTVTIKWRLNERQVS